MEATIVDMARLLSVVLLLSLLAGCGSARLRHGGQSTSDAVPAGSSRHTIQVDGRTREFLVYRPASVPEPTALVVMAHGGFGSDQQAERSYGWDALAEKEHFLVAYPDGLDHAWSVGGGCCGVPGREGVDDVAFVTAMVNTIGGWLPVDQKRVYATGMSNGAILVYRLACDSDRFAAIGPVAGTLLGECPSPHAVSLIHIHGEADTRVAYDGSPGQGIGRIDGPPVPTVVARFRSADRCDQPTSTVAAPVTTLTATCPDGRAVQLITVAGAGHQWPGANGGADPPSTALDATTTIWTFLEAHPAP
jgi:polyhydroxybutyrate depolymerase